jgi:5-hydroxyisourate hydrolase-like protein (transthyretin family)
MNAVLDSSRGKPAQGVAVRLEELVGNKGFMPLAQGYVSFQNRE